MKKAIFLLYDNCLNVTFSGYGGEMFLFFKENQITVFGSAVDRKYYM
jgi:hypothetical protein